MGQVVEGLTKYDDSTTNEPISSVKNRLAVFDDGAPGYAVAPQVSGSPTAIVALDGGGASGLMGFRAIAGADDDVTASDRLSQGGAGAATAPSDGVLSFSSQDGVTRLDVVGIRNAAAGGQCVNRGGDTLANALAQKTTFTFGEAVNKVVVSCVPDLTGQYGELTVEGYQYA